MTDHRTELATLGGGCFWCLEAPLAELEGVDQVTSGYAGGHLDDPSYNDVTSGTSGHAEVVQIRFDPSVISYRELLEAFFLLHDPTTLNRQGADVGSHYRSIILYHNDEQRRTAEALIAELEDQHTWDAPIVTEVVQLEKFFPAEEYHQNYYHRNPSQPYCQFVVRPKLQKLRQAYRDRLKQTQGQSAS